MLTKLILRVGLGVVLSIGALTMGCGSSSTDTPATGGTTATGGSTATGGTSTAAGGTSTAAGGAATATGGTTSATGGTTGVTLPGTACTDAQKKGAVCTTDGEVCYKTCGPAKSGYKTETCSSGTYAEGVCTFPAGDYACYKVSDATPACDAGTTSGNECTVGPCTPCKGYQDTSGAPKPDGYCVCVNNKYTCGNVKEWPCTPTGTSTSAGGTGC